VRSINAKRCVYTLNGPFAQPILGRSMPAVGRQLPSGLKRSPFWRRIASANNDRVIEGAGYPSAARIHIMDESPSGTHSSTLHEVIRFLRRFCATNYGARKHFGGIELCDDADTPRNTPTLDWLSPDFGGRQQTRYALDCGIHCTRGGSLRKS